MKRASRAADMLSLSAQPEELAHALALLGIRPDATVHEASQRYRTMVRACHPDLHASSALQRALATDRTAQINAAWELVRPAAEALARARREALDQERLGRQHALRAQTAMRARDGRARIISADAVRLEGPRVIPVPGLLGRGAA